MRDPEATPVTPTLRSFLGAAALVAELVPVVDLADDCVRCFDLMVRGERGGPFADARALRSSLAAVGATAASDEWRWQEAVRIVERDAHTGSRTPVNVPLHPDSLVALAGILDFSDTGRLVPVLDIPCSDVVFRAPEMSRAVDHARSLGLPVMVSGIVDESALPLVSVIGADVLCLDPEMMDTTDVETAVRRAAALSSMAVRPGPVLLAAGVHTAEDRRRAAAFGVDGASGGAMVPGDTDPDPAQRMWFDRAVVPSPARESLFDQVARGHSPQRVRKRELVELSRELEKVVLAGSSDSVLVGAFQSEKHFTADTEERWTDLAEHCSVTVAAGLAMPAEPAPDVEGLALADDDPILAEWHVAALSPHRAALLSARDLGDDGEDMERRFDFVHSYDRKVVATACRGILGRLPGRTPG